VEAHRLVAGEYFVRLAHGDAGSLELLLDVRVGEETRISRRLPAASGDGPGMVRVEQGAAPITGGQEQVPAFLIDKYEVTNAQYLEFVAAGGYRDSAFWPATLVVDGGEVPWEPAVGTFTDRSGLPGPRDWTDGRFPEGKGDHPVTGISWYEAAAFARWMGKELPTRDQWWLAALGEEGSGMPWGDALGEFALRANFETTGPGVVGARPLGVSPAGCFDMAGNVREWLREASQDGISRSAIGGSWRDPTYTFDPIFTEQLEPTYASDAIGFRLVMSIPRG
jgi:formylglycine-generating enzyme required for sulfatase activity